MHILRGFFVFIWLLSKSWVTIYLGHIKYFGIGIIEGIFVRPSRTDGIGRTPSHRTNAEISEKIKVREQLAHNITNQGKQC